MSTVVLPDRLALYPMADAALRAAARFWFVLAVAGQFIFAIYIAISYGGAAARGNPLAWNKSLAHGYESGNTFGNSVLAAHLLFAAVITLSGAFQLIPQFRARFPRFHRWNGRSYVMTALIMGASALYLELSGRRVVGDAISRVAVTGNAVVILLCAALAWRYAMLRDFKTHRRWALRLFLAVGGVWFFRVGLMFWVIVNRGPVGFDPKTFQGPFITFMTFAQYLLPLAVLELYLRTQDRAGAPGRFATASVLFVMTLAMGGGIFGAAMFMWRPRIKTAFDSRKSIAATLSAAIASRGIDEATRLYHQLKITAPSVYNFDRAELNILGYDFIHTHRLKEAIGVLQLNVEAYPKSSDAYDSLGEAYLKAGNKAQAIANYQKALQLDPGNRNAAQKLRALIAPIILLWLAF